MFQKIFLQSYPLDIKTQNFAAFFKLQTPETPIKFHFNFKLQQYAERL